MKLGSLASTCLAGGRKWLPTSRDTKVVCPFCSLLIATATDSILCPVQGIQVFNNSAATNYRYDDSSASTSTAEINYNEQRYMFNSATAGNMCLSYQINLEELSHTILAINKDLYFGENMILSLTFCPHQKFTWSTIYNASPFPGGDATGGANGPKAISDTAAGANGTTGVVISNMSLYLQVETNRNIVDGLIEKCRSAEGFSLLVPFVYPQKTNTGSGSSNSSIFFRMNKGHGKSLLRAYWGLFNNVETLNSTLDRSNSTNGKITDLRTTINTLNLQEFTMTSNNSLDWLVNSENIEGSSILSIDQYKYLMCNIDDFSCQKPLCSCDDTLECGKKLDEEQTYGVYCTTASGQYNHYLFLVVQRELRISGGQIMFV